MEPFSTSVFEVLILIFATAAKICTRSWGLVKGGGVTDSAFLHSQEHGKVLTERNVLRLRKGDAQIAKLPFTQGVVSGGV